MSQSVCPPLPSPSPRRSTLLRLLGSPGLRALLAICLIGWLLLEGLEALGGPEGIRARWGFGAALILVPLHAVAAVSPFPSEVIALAHGAIYGFALGWPLTWAGWFLGALLEYGLFRRIASDVAATDDRMPKWLLRFPVHHPLFLILGRLVPFGNHAVNALAGSRRVPLGRFAWASAVSFLPFSALMTAFATGLVSW